MKSTRAVDVKIQAVSPLLISAKAGDENKQKKIVINKFLTFLDLNEFRIIPP